MHATHAPGAPRKHHAAEPAAPLLERLAVGGTKCAKLGKGLKEHGPLPPSHRKRWVSMSERLEASGPTIGRETPHPGCAKDTPAALIELCACKPLLALKLLLDSLAHPASAIGVFERRRQGERQLDGVGPVRIVWVEENRGPLYAKRPASELMGKHGDTGPVPCFPDKACLNRIGHDPVKLQLGYMAGASGLNGNRAWGHFVDLILSAEIRRFTLTFNGNATVNPLIGARQYALGGALSGEMKVRAQWRVGARVEYIAGTVALPDGKDPDRLTVTATVRYIPVQYLVISLEPRFERAQQEIFFTRSSPTDTTTGDQIANGKRYFGLVLGVSAYLGN